MERLSPFGYVLVSHVLFIYLVNAHAQLLNEMLNGLLKICACCIITDEISASCCSGSFCSPSNGWDDDDL